MNFDESLQSIEQGLKSNWILVSDATLAMMAFIHEKKREQLKSFGKTDSFFDTILATLNEELLGYEKPEWNLRTSFRRCHGRTARMDQDAIVYVPNVLPESALVMMWGSQQVEALLSDVMDLSVYQSGDQEKIDGEVTRLTNNNSLFHAESGVEDIWIVFSGTEVLRLYLQLKDVLIDFCNALVRHERGQGLSAASYLNANTQITFSSHQFFR